MERYSSKSIDEMRRMVLPLEIRQYMGLEAGTAISLQKISTIVILHHADEKESASGTVDELGRITLPTELMQEMGDKG